MAIADGVIDGIGSDIASLCSHQQSGWLLLPYKQDSPHLPVLRRTGNKSRVISSCSIKPSVLYTMMQAQLNQGGHKETFATMLRDMRNAIQRVQIAMELLRGDGYTKLIYIEVRY
jgi:hypothetical protein